MPENPGRNKRFWDQRAAPFRERPFADSSSLAGPRHVALQVAPSISHHLPHSSQFLLSSQSTRHFTSRIDPPRGSIS